MHLDVVVNWPWRDLHWLDGKWGTEVLNSWTVSGESVDFPSCPGREPNLCGFCGSSGGSVKVLHVMDMKSVFSFSCICCRMQCEVASAASELLRLLVSVCEVWIYEIDDGDEFFCVWKLILCHSPFLLASRPDVWRQIQVDVEVYGRRPFLWSPSHRGSWTHHWTFSCS